MFGQQPDRKEPKAFILRRDPEGRSAGRSLDHTDMPLHLHRGGREPSAALLRSGVRRRFATGYATVRRFFVDPQTQLDQRPTGHLIAIMETASRRLLIPMMSPGCTDLISPRIPR